MKEGLYFIAILPPDDIAEEVQAVKKEFAETYNSKEAYHRPAHFTLQPPFKMPERNEPDIISALQSFAKNQQSFRVQLAGFNHFRDDVIFIDIEDSSGMKSLHRNLIHFLQDEMGFTNKIIRNKSLTPHMTVAYRDLDSDQFHKAWPKFSERSFNYKFQVKSIFLLKHDYRQWQIYHEFTFLP